MLPSDELRHSLRTSFGITVDAPPFTPEGKSHFSEKSISGLSKLATWKPHDTGITAWATYTNVGEEN